MQTQQISISYTVALRCVVNAFNRGRELKESFSLPASKLRV